MSRAFGFSRRGRTIARRPTTALPLSARSSTSSNESASGRDSEGDELLAASAGAVARADDPRASPVRAPRDLGPVEGYLSLGERRRPGYRARALLRRSPHQEALPRRLPPGPGRNS